MEGRSGASGGSAALPKSMRDFGGLNPHPQTPFRLFLHFRKEKKGKVQRRSKYSLSRYFTTFTYTGLTRKVLSCMQKWA